MGATFTLTPREPEVTCTFTNSFKPDPGESKWATLDLSKAVRGPAGSRCVGRGHLASPATTGRPASCGCRRQQDESAGWAEPMVFSRFPGGEVVCDIVETATRRRRRLRRGHEDHRGQAAQSAEHLDRAAYAA